MWSYDCVGTIYEIFVKIIHKIQCYNMEKKCSFCDFNNLTESNEYLLDISREFFFDDTCRECKNKLSLKIEFFD